MQFKLKAEFKKNEKGIRGKLEVTEKPDNLSATIFNCQAIEIDDISRFNDKGHLNIEDVVDLDGISRSISIAGKHHQVDKVNTAISLILREVKEHLRSVDNIDLPNDKIFTVTPLHISEEDKE